MSGPIREHTLVYTVVIAATLTVFFDLSRIASLGAFFYMVMDTLIHWGVFRRLRHEIGASGAMLISAIALDVIVLGVFGAMKLQSDSLIVAIAGVSIVGLFAYERVFLSRWMGAGKPEHH